MELADQTALITGGTAGSGLTCSRLLAREGGAIIITDQDTERDNAAAARFSGSVRFIQADQSDIESVKSLVAQAGDVDILVNNAASFPSAMTVHLEVTLFEKTFDTNVRGTRLLAAGLLPRLLKRGRGSMVNVTSSPAPGLSSSARAGFGSTASLAAPPISKGSRRNGARQTKSWDVHCRWAAPLTGGDRRSGALPRVAILGFHHPPHPARRRERQRDLKHNDGGMTHVEEV